MKDPHAVALGSQGGKAAAAKLNADTKRIRASNAAKIRWIKRVVAGTLKRPERSRNTLRRKVLAELEHRADEMRDSAWSAKDIARAIIVPEWAGGIETPAVSYEAWEYFTKLVKPLLKELHKEGVIRKDKRGYSAQPSPRRTSGLKDSQ